MALDTTVAGTDSDSYITVAEADEMAEDRLGREADSWADASVHTKERALRQAARDLESLVRTATRYSPDQALLFPRSVDVDDLDLPFIPARVKRAQFEQAIYLVHNADLLSDAATRRARGLFSFSEDNLQGSIAVDSQIGLIAPRAEQLMATLSRSARGTLRSVPLSTGTYTYSDRLDDD